MFDLSSRLQYETLHEERGRGGRKLHVFMWTGVSKITLSMYLCGQGFQRLHFRYILLSFRRIGCRRSAKGMDSAAQREYRRLWSFRKGLISICIVNLTFTGYPQKDVKVYSFTNHIQGILYIVSKSQYPLGGSYILGTVIAQWYLSSSMYTHSMDNRAQNWRRWWRGKPW